MRTGAQYRGRRRLADATTSSPSDRSGSTRSYIISSLGPWALLGVALIIFAECGLLIGFFLPGDSLLFITGLAATTGLIETPLWLVCVVLVVAAFAGNVCGYYIGRKAGPAIFDKPNSRLFKRENVERTQKFFDKYGNRAIVLGRFVPDRAHLHHGHGRRRADGRPPLPDVLRDRRACSGRPG